MLLSNYQKYAKLIGLPVHGGVNKNMADEENRPLTQLVIDDEYGPLGPGGVRALMTSLLGNGPGMKGGPYKLLSSLRIWRSNIGDEGTQSIAEALRLGGAEVKIAFLELLDNNIGPRGAMGLGQVRHPTWTTWSKPSFAISPIMIRPPRKGVGAGAESQPVDPAAGLQPHAGRGGRGQPLPRTADQHDAQTGAVGHGSRLSRLSTLNLPCTRARPLTSSPPSPPFPSLPLLRQLHLTFCQLPPEAGEPLGEIMANAKSALEVLSLGGNRLGGRGLFSICQGLAGNTKLKELKMADNMIDHLEVDVAALEVHNVRLISPLCPTSIPPVSALYPSCVRLISL